MLFLLIRGRTGGQKPGFDCAQPAGCSHKDTLQSAKTVKNPVPFAVHASKSV